MPSSASPFHYAFKVDDLESTRQFYLQLLGCTEGRSTDHWVDFDFFGHQLSAHVAPNQPPLDYCGQVDGVAVPIPHFGAVIPTEDFQVIQDRLEQSGVTFIIPPTLRYAGKPGEQMTMFVLDPSGNPLEFKAYSRPDEVFQQ